MELSYTAIPPGLPHRYYARRFWKFYEKNERDINAILTHSCNQYGYCVDPREMHSEILVRLFNSRCLERFNPARTKLNSYLTTYIRGYASHISQRELDNPLWKSGSKGNRKGAPWVQKRYSAFNAVGEDEIETDLGTESFEDKVEFKDLLEKAIQTNSLVRGNPKQAREIYKICNLLIEGYNVKEIAEILNVTTSLIFKIVRGIRQDAKAIALAQ